MTTPLSSVLLHETLSTLSAIDVRNQQFAIEIGEDGEKKITVKNKSVIHKIISFLQNGAHYWTPCLAPTSYANKVPEVFIQFLEIHARHYTDSMENVPQCMQQQLSQLAGKIKLVDWLETEKTRVIEKIDQILQNAFKGTYLFSMLPSDIINSNIASYMHVEELARLCRAIPLFARNNRLHATFPNSKTFQEAIDGHPRNIRWLVKTLVKIEKNTRQLQESNAELAKKNRESIKSLVHKFFKKASDKGINQFFRSLSVEKSYDTVVDFLPSNLKEIDLSLAFTELQFLTKISTMCPNIEKIRVDENFFFSYLTKDAFLKDDNLLAHLCAIFPKLKELTWVTFQPLTLLRLSPSKIVDSLNKVHHLEHLEITISLSPDWLDKLERFGNLKSLKVIGDPTISFDVKLLAECKTLEAFSTNCHLENFDDVPNIPFLSHLKSFEVFVYQGMTLENLVRILEKTPNLTSLYICMDYSFTLDGFVYEAIQKLYHLTHLNISGGSTQNDRIKDLIQSLPQLESFIWAPLHGMFNIGPETASYIASHDSLKELILGNMRYRGEMTPEAVKLLLQSKSLESIGLKGIQAFPPDAFLDLPHPERIRKLDLSKSELSDEVINTISTLTALRTLKLSHIFKDKWVAALKNLVNLETLDVSCSDFTAKGFVELINTLPNIQRLNLKSCEIDISDREFYTHVKRLKNLSECIPPHNLSILRKDCDFPEDIVFL